MTLLKAIAAQYRLGLVLLALIGLLMASVIIERSYFSTVNDQSASIFYDRLMPTNYVYRLADHLATRRWVLAMDTTQPGTTLQHHHEAMAQVVEDFEQTYLVQEEAVSLNAFKNQLAHYRHLEQQWLANPTPHIRQQLRQCYNILHRELNTLSRIQTRIGAHLMENTRKLVTTAKLITIGQVTLLLIIALLLQLILRNAYRRQPEGTPTSGMN